jgi:ABC-type multidrug transport system ATPase subunit
MCISQYAQGLKRVAQTGVTVTAVIHQPSYETFCLFDDLVLLAKGGLTAYCGPQRDVRVSNSSVVELI